MDTGREPASSRLASDVCYCSNLCLAALWFFIDAVDAGSIISYCMAHAVSNVKALRSLGVVAPAVLCTSDSRANASW